MKSFVKNNQQLPVGQPFELEGEAYPWNWFDLATPADLAKRQIAIVEVPDAAPSSLRTIDEKLAAIGLTLSELQTGLDGLKGKT